MFRLVKVFKNLIVEETSNFNLYTSEELVGIRAYLMAHPFYALEKSVVFLTADDESVKDLNSYHYCHRDCIDCDDQELKFGPGWIKSLDKGYRYGPSWFFDPGNNKPCWFDKVTCKLSRAYTMCWDTISLEDTIHMNFGRNIYSWHNIEDCQSRILRPEFPASKELAHFPFLKNTCHSYIRS